MSEPRSEKGTPAPASAPALAKARPGAPYLTHPRLAAVPGLVHGFGLRGWEPADVERTWPGFRLVELEQTHSADVHFIDGPPDGRPRGDALATDRPGLLLAIRTADCLPILIADAERRVAAAVHAGWRGTSLGIAARVVRALAGRYGSRPADLVAVLGPCIGTPCYEVGEDVRAEFLRAGAGAAAFADSAGGPGKYILDLRAANRAQLEAAGLPAEAVADVGCCTHCDPRLLSYRRDRDTTARLYNVIGIRCGIR